MHDELKDVDHVIVFFGDEFSDCQFKYNFSEYTHNKIKLMYGFELPKAVVFDFTDEDEDDVMCFIPRCYRAGNTFLLPFHEYEKLCDFITTHLGYSFNWLHNDKIISVAKSNTDSVNKMYRYLKSDHQLIIDDLNNRQQSAL